MPVVASIAETLMSKAAVAEIVFVAVLADVNEGVDFFVVVFDDPEKSFYVLCGARFS